MDVSLGMMIKVSGLRVGKNRAKPRGRGIEFLESGGVLSYKRTFMATTVFSLRVLAKLLLPGLAIFGLTACTGVQSDTDQHRLNDWSTISLAFARENMEQYGRSMLAQLHDISASYPSGANTRFDSLAQQVARMSDRLNERIFTAKNRLSKGGQVSVEAIGQFEKEALLLRDSLLLCSGNNQAIKASLPDVQLPNDAGSASNNEAALVLENLMVRITQSKLVMLEYFLGHISDADVKFDRYMPAASPKNPAPRVGELYEADVFLTEHFSETGHVKVSVNGELLPVEDGVAHFTKRFTTAGEKRYTVNIQIKNPLTQEVKAYVKEFSLHVLPPEQ